MAINNKPQVVEKTNKPNRANAIAIVALVWNLLGVMAFASQTMMSPEMIAQLSQAEQNLYANVPLWATLSFALAVFAGTLGSLALIMKKALCYPLFIASLIGVILQTFHAFLLNNSYQVYGPSSIIMPTLVLIIATLLVFYSAKKQNAQWFN